MIPIMLKLEIRNSKSESNLSVFNFECLKHFVFKFVSSFGIRASDFSSEEI